MQLLASHRPWSSVKRAAGRDRDVPCVSACVSAGAESGPGTRHDPDAARRVDQIFIRTLLRDGARGGSPAVIHLSLTDRERVESTAETDATALPLTTPPPSCRTDGRTRRPLLPLTSNMQWFFVKNPTAAAYRRLHANAAACPSEDAPRGRRRHLKRSARGLSTAWRLGAEDHRPRRKEGDTAGNHSASAAATTALLAPLGEDAEYVLLSGLAEGAGAKAGGEPGFLLLLWSMVQLGAGKTRTEPRSWPPLLACEQGGAPAFMRWVNLRLPHPEILSPPAAAPSSSTVSTKSMRFIWNNIFSKGSHMLQCLCGRSLKKKQNPTGEFFSLWSNAARFDAVGLQWSEPQEEVQRRVCNRRRRKLSAAESEFRLEQVQQDWTWTDWGHSETHGRREDGSKVGLSFTLSLNKSPETKPEINQDQDRTRSKLGLR